jgi:hypothetical protein
MNILQRIWSDVRRGENIDLYLAVSVSFVLNVLKQWNWEVQ